MKSRGIRINDVKENGVVAVQLSDILEEIHDGNLFHWAILYLDASGHLGEGQSIPVFEKQIYDSENGFYISWNELNSLSKKFYQIIDIMLIGCKDKSFLHRYDNDQNRLESCDFVIDMNDSTYWEVFS
jgi:hypothetical protein